MYCDYNFTKNDQNMRPVNSQMHQNVSDIVLPSIQLADFGTLIETDINNVTKNTWTIINVWATWCTPCLNEIPELDDFKRTETMIPFNLVGITYEAKTQSELDAFFKHYFDSFPSYTIKISKNNPSIELQKLLNQGLPQTYIFNPQGVLLSRHVGELTSALMSFKMKELLEAPR